MSLKEELNNSKKKRRVMEKLDKATMEMHEKQYDQSLRLEALKFSANLHREPRPSNLAGGELIWPTDTIMVDSAKKFYEFLKGD